MCIINRDPSSFTFLVIPEQQLFYLVHYGSGQRPSQLTYKYQFRYAWGIIIAYGIGFTLTGYLSLANRNQKYRGGMR
jgi:hypothetical protein